MNRLTHGPLTKEVNMEIRVQSVKFDADQKLLDFIEKKFSKLPRFYENIVTTEVTLSLLNDHENKNVKVNVHIPGNSIVVERSAKSFETAVNDCADILKEQLTRRKELMQE